MLPPDLETWLTTEGDKVMRKVAANPAGANALSRNERLLYEIWLFDTEQRNGGVSQYFCNHDLSQWDSLCSVASELGHFGALADKLNQVVTASVDPYQAVIDSGVNFDALYEELQIPFITALYSFLATSIEN